MKRIKELDGLRAIAIMAVLFCHYYGFVRLSGRLSEFGWVGVDIFFVLSGYLITSILLGLRDTSRRYITFYSRRIIRIFPAYFCVTFLILATAFLLQDSTLTSANNIVKQLFFLQAAKKQFSGFALSWLFHPLQRISHLPDLFSHAGNLPQRSLGEPPTIEAQVGTYWSLSIEEFFYLFWAPIVLTFHRRIIVGIGIGICLAEVLLRWSFASHEAYFGIYFRFDALIYGAFLAMLMERWRCKGFPLWANFFLRGLFFLSAAGLASILIALRPIVGREVRDSPLFLAFGLPMISLVCASTVGTLILRAGSEWWVARFLRTGFMQLIGRVSYAMYLVEFVAMAMVTHVLWGDSPDLPLWQLLVQGVLAAIVTTGIALLSWHVLEGPLLRWKNARLRASTSGESALDPVNA